VLANDSLLLTHKHHYNVKDLSGKKCSLKSMQYFLFQLYNLEQFTVILQF